MCNQTGGDISFSGGWDNPYPYGYPPTIGNAAYGCYNMSGGTFKINTAARGNTFLGAANTGIINLTGGTMQFGNSTNLYAGGDDVGRTGYALMNISGGTFMMGAAVADEGWALILGYNGTGVLNMSGTGVIDFKGTDAAKGWLFASARTPKEPVSLTWEKWMPAAAAAAEPSPTHPT